jgi:FixJ family two-component response regulator
MTAASAGTIAIVDDDQAARDALLFLLTVLGRQAVAFASATGFLNSDLRVYGGAILDHHMPEMTGLELAARLRAERGGVPIMLVSGGLLTSDVIEKAAKLKIDVVTDKPPEPTVLSSFLAMTGERSPPSVDGGRSGGLAEEGKSEP